MANVLPLDDSGIFHEKVKQVYLYSDEINMCIGIDINDVYEKLNHMKTNIMFIEKVCKNKCEVHNEIIPLNRRIEKLEALAYQLRLLTHNYALTKRGLLNVVGSISKSLFGTLDTYDLDLININIDKLFQDGN